ncbi:hypothetical protein ACQKLP_12320 [Chitinophaga sp. NPDC101104]|uniref:hypothetical protein n=1 Tax=Chitinophaga sp. NPDC101104 TaxID=3390561 RepID=UPI003D025683
MLKPRSWLFFLILIAPVSIWGTPWYLPVQFAVAFCLWGWWFFSVLRWAERADVPEWKGRLANCREAWPLWVSSLVMFGVSLFFPDPPKVYAGLRVGAFMAGGSVLLVAHVYISWQIAHVLAELSGKRERWMGWMVAVALVLPIPVFIQGKVNAIFRQVDDQTKRRDDM